MAVLQEKGVEWEMATRWRWDGSTELEMRALNLDEVEIKVTAKNGYGAAIGHRTMTFADLRKALDVLQTSARSIEMLGRP
jgi:hypothetical protein